MAALTSLSTKLFARTSEKSLSPSRLALHGRFDFGFSPSLSFKKASLDHLILLRGNDAWSVNSRRVASDAEALPGFDTTGSGIQQTRPSKTVHVKFQLQKKCMFGEHFLLVGDYPMLGLWDPSNAIPLNWSDGHVWSVKLDLPIEVTMQFKLILKRTTGKIIWQPGPDRIFKTWECRNTVVVAEDWENAGAQKIMEEPEAINPDSESTAALDVPHESKKHVPNIKNGAALPENAEHEIDKPIANNESIKRGKNIYPVEEHLINATQKLNLKASADSKRDERLNTINSRTLTGKNPATVDDEETILGYEQGPAIVPGLVSLQASSTDEAIRELGSVIVGDSSIGADADKNQNIPEVIS